MTNPVGADEFAGLMRRLGPFEPAPRLAVAVSGGGDSMALAVLAAGWAAAQGGSLIALTVDHGLRPAAAAEAAAAGASLAARAIPHEILRWFRPPGAGASQAAARGARYALLDAAAARHGALHLLTAHTAEDQAETLLQRLARGAGPAGLAAMPAVRELTQCRLLRPLLGIAKARLQATCRAAGLAWAEDPSNADPRFERARLRAAAPALAGLGLTPGRLGAAAAAAGAWRRAMQQAAGDLLGQAAAVHPEAYATLEREPLVAAPPPVAAAALAGCLRAIGGQAHAPAPDLVDRILGWLAAEGRGRRTAGRCLVAAGRQVTLLREGRELPAAALPAGPEAILWDGRFHVRRPPDADDLPLEIRPLGPLARRLFAAGAAPAAALAALPGGFRDGRLLALPRIPHGPLPLGLAPPMELIVDFRPRQAAAGPAFTVVWSGPGII